MIKQFAFRQMIKERHRLCGMIQTLDSPEVTEILIASGFDWLWIDLEHSSLNMAAAQRLLQTAGSAAPCVIRIPGHEEVWIKQALDSGAAGIIVPQVKTAAEAETIVRFARYPPQGCRSVGLSRAHGYGMSFKSYIETANQDVAIILQIEHIEGVNNIEKIVKVPGVDALLIGPYDLSGSMGKIGQVEDPEVQAKIDHVGRVCLDSGMALGIFTTQPRQAESFFEKGFTLVAAGIDVIYLGQIVKQARQEMLNPPSN